MPADIGANQDVSLASFVIFHYNTPRFDASKASGLLLLGCAIIPNLTVGAIPDSGGFKLLASPLCLNW